MSESSSPPVAKSSMVFVFLVVLIDMLGFGIIMPVLPEYHRWVDLQCRGLCRLAGICLRGHAICLWSDRRQSV